ncbi:hypothetical protein, partial [Candidatus Avelusimicrobium fimicolum]|uniref:hypothetical protein n=1 Tax=Candidatus Avelusimicrobium fimicolum TaxID=3416216 RepID=UPI003D0C5556
FWFLSKNNNDVGDVCYWGVLDIDKCRYLLFPLCATSYWGGYLEFFYLLETGYRPNMEAIQDCIYRHFAVCGSVGLDRT